jgi:hypothetical protein
VEPESWLPRCLRRSAPRAFVAARIYGYARCPPSSLSFSTGAAVGSHADHGPMENVLLPCPFCGHARPEPGGLAVHCPECGTYGPAQTTPIAAAFAGTCARTTAGWMDYPSSGSDHEAWREASAPRCRTTNDAPGRPTESEFVVARIPIGQSSPRQSRGGAGQPAGRIAYLRAPDRQAASP